VLKVANSGKKSNIAGMNVYLFRHGQKGSTPLSDPDLTEYGYQQSRALAEKIREGDFLPGTQFLASPRLRAQSTLRMAALLCQVPLRIEPTLDQRESYESAEDFRTRISELIHSLTKLYSGNDTVYLCTHHDWVEEALSLIPADVDLLDSKYWSWSPAQFAHFKVKDGVWEFLKFDKVQP
jgi:broad specificity phosphatase PhoE